MTATRTVPAKVGDWKQAFDALREELTSVGARDLLLQMTAAAKQGGTAYSAFIELHRIVSANDRAAAMVAALLTANGVKPVSLDIEEGD